ncbi:unnamed protein product, partial [Polarella glacialis]
VAGGGAPLMAICQTQVWRNAEACDAVAEKENLTPRWQEESSQREGLVPSGAGHLMRRRNSQIDFSSPEQTIIILDWDDTLFPLTYVRTDLHLDPNVALQ